MADPPAAACLLAGLLSESVAHASRVHREAVEAKEAERARILVSLSAAFARCQTCALVQNRSVYLHKSRSNLERSTLGCLPHIARQLYFVGTPKKIRCVYMPQGGCRFSEACLPPNQTACVQGVS